MLPEQAFREFLTETDWRGCVGTTTARFWLLFFLSHTKRQAANVIPQTLTGDAWRAAWATKLAASASAG